MKFLIVGLGSMGKRRIRNLKYLQQEDIIGFDVSKERTKEIANKYSIETCNNIEEVLEKKPDVLIISTPPELHMKYAKIAIENGIHFFTEASVVQDDMEDVVKQLDNSDIVGLPSCTMRYHPIVKKVNEVLKSGKLGKVLAFTYHSGQYLPDWHPWEDYRKFYVSQKETGACREIVPFELVWITSTFGKIKKVFSDKAKISSLAVDIDDIYNVLLDCENGVKGVLTVDIISRPAIRKLTILTERGTVIADWYAKSVNYYIFDQGWKNVMIDDGLIEKDYLHGEKMYIEEMENLLNSIQKKINPPYTFSEDLKILKILSAIEKSSDTGSQQLIN